LEMLADYAVGIFFAVWVYVLIHGVCPDVAPAYVRTTKIFSGFSYTLYLTHFPALLLLRALLDPQGTWQPDSHHLIYAGLIGLVILAYAYLVAQLTEARTATVRRRILQPWAARPKRLVPDS
jgi:peptidoglycan/LPS O-acetylase OafA/YrhL